MKINIKQKHCQIILVLYLYIKKITYFIDLETIDYN